MLGDADYEGPVGLLTKVMAGRFGSGLGTFFFGFLTSRRRASLFPMRIGCHSFQTLQLRRELANLNGNSLSHAAK